MEKDKSEIPISEGLPTVLDSRIQEQIKLDIPTADTPDAPASELPVGNVIDISGDLIDKIMAKQTARKDSISVEAQEKEAARSGRSPRKRRRSPARAAVPRQRGPRPRGQAQAQGPLAQGGEAGPGGGGARKSARAPSRTKSPECPPQSRRRPAPSRARTAAPAQGRLPWGKGRDCLSGPFLNSTRSRTTPSASGTMWK